MYWLYTEQYLRIQNFVFVVLKPILDVELFMEKLIDNGRWCWFWDPEIRYFLHAMVKYGGWHIGRIRLTEMDEEEE